MPLPGDVNIFCAGHAHRADGKLVVTGGTDHGIEVGITDNLLFDYSTLSWSALPDMAYRRWYATINVLPDDRMFVNGGTQHVHAWMFGGKEPGATVPEGNLERFAVKHDSFWDTSILSTGTLETDWPMPRVGHAASINVRYTPMLLWGGQDSVGAYPTQLWAMYRSGNPRGDDYDYLWQHFTPSGSFHPAGRYEHTMVYNSLDDKMSIFGGRRLDGAYATIYGDTIWQIEPRVGLSPPWAWDFAIPDTTLGNPGRRFGHTAIMDEARNRMLVFGGAKTLAGALADNDVWALDFDDTPPTWSKPPLRGSQKPSARWGQTLTIAPATTRASGTFGPRAMMFGGHGSFGGDTLTAEVWDLWLDSDALSDTLEWYQLSPTGFLHPSARARHTAICEAGKNSITVFGGDVGGGSSDSYAWLLQLDLYHPETNAQTWSRGDSRGAGLIGQSEIAAYDPVMARFPEILNAPQTTWQTKAPLLTDWYPFQFVLPDGSLYTAGPSPDFGVGDRHRTWRMDLASGQWYPMPANASIDTLAFTGGTAVMYRPGKIMKCGTRDTEGGVATAATRWIDFSPGSADTTWQKSYNDMIHGRVYHNLTLLPSGEVLVTGGCGIANNATPTDSVQQPEIWNPLYNSGQGRWYGGSGTNALAREPAVRGYHANALLLPDGRVLSASGNQDPILHPDQQRVTLYSPPYLFNSDGTWAVRPNLMGSPRSVVYGDSFSVCVSNAGNIATACLIRASSVTHNFNPDQRYVPLDFHWCGIGQRLRLQAPSDSNSALPGDYMLFVLNSSGVPSIARWLRLVHKGSGLGSSEISCNDCSGGGGGCPFVDTWTPGGWQIENSILGRSMDGSMVPDAYRLSRAPNVADERVRLRVRENERELTTLDHVELVAVDHSADTRAFHLNDRTVLAHVAADFRVTNAEGEDISSQVSGSGAYQGSPGDTLYVQPGTPAARTSASPNRTEDDEGGSVVLNGFEKDPGEENVRQQLGGGLVAQSADARVLDGTGILVQASDGQGGWRTVKQYYPREYADDYVVDSLGTNKFRLVFVGRHSLGLIGRLSDVAEATGVSALELLSAQHSRFGDVKDALSAGGGGNTTLATGDTLAIEFAATSIPSGMTRDYFLNSTGVYTTVEAASQRPTMGDGLPTEFALSQNRPNPFARGTSIRFALPRAEHVDLRVFDLQGRLIRVLEDRRLAAGFHMAEWDHKDGSGHTVRSGVYLYRLSAGSFVDQKKMVLLPR